MPESRITGARPNGSGSCDVILQTAAQDGVGTPIRMILFNPAADVPIFNHTFRPDHEDGDVWKAKAYRITVEVDFAYLKDPETTGRLELLSGSTPVHVLAVHAFDSDQGASDPGTMEYEVNAVVGEMPFELVGVYLPSPPVMREG